MREPDFFLPDVANAKVTFGDDVLMSFKFIKQPLQGERRSVEERGFFGIGKKIQIEPYSYWAATDIKPHTSEFTDDTTKKRIEALRIRRYSDALNTFYYRAYNAYELLDLTQRIFKQGHRFNGLVLHGSCLYLDVPDVVLSVESQVICKARFRVSSDDGLLKIEHSFNTATRISPADNEVLNSYPYYINYIEKAP